MVQAVTPHIIPVVSIFFSIIPILSLSYVYIRPPYNPQIQGSNLFCMEYTGTKLLLVRVARQLRTTESL